METYCNKVNIQITQRDDFIQTVSDSSLEWIKGWVEPGVSLDVLQGGRDYYPAWESNHIPSALLLIASVVKERACNGQQCIFMALAFKRRHTYFCAPETCL